MGGDPARATQHLAHVDPSARALPDVVWCPPGVKHWRAAPGSAMTHIALTGIRDGQAVEWLQKVTDAQYNASTSG